MDATRPPTLVRSLLLVGLAAGALAACGDATTGPAAPPIAPPCTAAVLLCSERLPLGAGRYLPVYRNSPATGDGAVEHAVVVVHGTDRNADTYFGLFTCSRPRSL